MYTAQKVLKTTSSVTNDIRGVYGDFDEQLFTSETGYSSSTPNATIDDQQSLLVQPKTETVINDTLLEFSSNNRINGIKSMFVERVFGLEFLIFFSMKIFPRLNQLNYWELHGLLAQHHLNRIEQKLHYMNQWILLTFGKISYNVVAHINFRYGY